MRSSTYDLAGSGLTFEIMRFGSNTCQDFNYHLPEAQSNPQIPSSRWTTLCRDKNLNRPRGSRTPEALYSETVSGYTFSPRIRTGIAAGPNLQLIGLGFTRNLLLKKASPEPAHKPGDTVRTGVHREW